MKRRSAAECIATHYGQDIADVRENSYQEGRYSSAIFTMFDGYVCCPPAGRKPPKEYIWKEEGTVFENRVVYFATEGSE